MTTSTRRYRSRWLAFFAAGTLAATAAISGVTAPSALASEECYASNPAYFADSCWDSSVPLTGMTDEFAVPPNPTSTGKSSFAIWGGLDESSSATVLQNVLFWNGSSWSYYPEYYIGDGRNFNYTAIPVSAGNTLVSKITSSDCDSAGQCTWTLTADDASTGKFSVSPPIGSLSSFNFLLGGVLEVDSASGCLSLPPSGHIAFRNISVENLNFQYPTPDFGVGTPDHQCSMTVSASATSTDFLWAP
jgi:hypothetical protein